MLNIDGEVHLTINDRQIEGIPTPWNKFAQQLNDIDIQCVRSEKELNEYIESSDIVIYGHPRFAFDTKHNQGMQTAFQANKPVYGLFWGDFDNAAEGNIATIAGAKVHEPTLNPIQLGSNSAEEDLIASVISKITEAEESINDEELEFTAYMRELSGYEGHSQQTEMPGSTIEGMEIKILPKCTKFIHLIDNYVVDKVSRMILRINREDETIRAVCQLNQYWIDELEEELSINEKMLVAYKIKALHVYENRLSNVENADHIIKYFKQAYLKNEGIIEAQIMGAMIMAAQKMPLKLDNLRRIYNNGTPEAGILLLRILNDRGEKLSNTETQIVEQLSELGYGNFTLQLASILKNKGKKHDHLIKLADEQSSPAAMYIVAIEQIGNGMVESGLNKLVLSGELGDLTAKIDLPDIIEHLKSNHKELVPFQHLRNLTKYKAGAAIAKNISEKLEVE